MQIDRIELYRVRMPLVIPFRTAFGNDDTLESVLVRLDAGECCGWGETAPWTLPAYSPEWSAGAYLVMKDVLGPLLLGRTFESPAEIQGALAGVKGNYFAKAGFDLAAWDLHARLRGRPLWRVLGGTVNVVAVGADFGVLDSIDELLASVDQAVKAGYRRIKLKYRPGWELDMVTAVRSAFPKTVFHIDCNSAYTLDDLPMFKKLDRFGLAMIEQPLAHDDLLDHARLQAAIGTPVCLDESITSVAKARQAAQIKACRWVNIKPGRVGGLTHAIAIHDVCRDAGIPCWVGGMLESAVGARHCLALATLPNIQYPSDIFPTERFYTHDLSAPPMALCAPSEMQAPDVPGVGAVPDPEMLLRSTVESATLLPQRATERKMHG